MRLNIISILLSVLGWAQPAFSTLEIVSEQGPTARCEELRIGRELRIYKDPSLFLGALSLIFKDPHLGWDNLMRENPLLTTLRGTAQLLRLGPPREFKNFGFVAKLYENVEPRLRLEEVPSSELSKKNKGKRYAAAEIVPVMLCGDSDAYRNTMGFLLVSDMKAAQAEAGAGGGSMPPSVNSIPEWKEFRP